MIFKCSSNVTVRSCRRRVALGFLVAGWMMFAAALPVLAAGDEKIVSAVDVEGNNTVAKHTILSQIRTLAQRPLDSAVLSEDLKRLYGLGFFKDVQIKQIPDASGVKVVFAVQEKSVLSDVQVVGNQKINTPDILKVIKSQKGAFFDEQTVRRDIEAVRKLYEEKGFYEAKMSHELEEDAAQSQGVLRIRVDEGVKLVVQRIEFKGVQKLKTGDIQAKIQTKPFGWFGLIPGTLKSETLDLDVQRIRGYYDENGYSDTKVSYRFENTSDPGQVVLTFDIEEGAQYLFGDQTFEDHKIFKTEELLKSLTHQTGAPFSRSGLRQNVTNIQDLYFEKGYMNAKVSFDSVLNDKTGRVDCRFRITENRVTYVGRVRVRGNAKTKDIVIRRELRVYPGEPFNGAALKRSKERLFNLGYFEEVQFDTEDTENPDTKDLLVTVKETKTGEFSFGGGFSSVDRMVGFAQIRQRNFDHADYPTFTGAGEDLALRVQLGSVRSQGELSWTDPWFMGYPFSLGTDFYKREIDRTRSSGIFFDEDRLGGRLRLGKELTDYDRVNLTYGYEEVEISDIPDEASADLQDEEGDTALSRLSFLYTRDTRDNRFVPTKGYLIQGGAETVGGFLGGDRDFWRLTGSGVRYWETWKKDWVVELQLRTGVSNAFGDSEKVPIFERYYAGGANTVRGYRERRIGPRDSGTQDPIGGEAYWVGNAEYTVPLYPGLIKGAAFYDIGAVDGLIEDYLSGDIAQGVGLGVRIKTPIGPVKVDMGYPLDDVEGEKKEVRFYFNMSRGF